MKNSHICENCTQEVEAPSFCSSRRGPCSSYCIACLAYFPLAFSLHRSIICRKEYHMRQAAGTFYCWSFLQNIRFLFVEGAIWYTAVLPIWQRAWKTSGRGRAAVLPVTGLRLSEASSPKRTDLISLRQHYPSVRWKCGKVKFTIAVVTGRYLWCPLSVFRILKSKEGYKSSTQNF